MVSAQADDEFCAYIHEGSRGNPLFLREMARAFAAEGLEPTGANTRRMRELGIRAVRRAVALRLSRMAPEAAAIARALAILGDGAQPAQAATLAEVDEEAASVATVALRDADVLSVQPALAFVHPVVRAVVEDELSPADRDRAHRLAARLLADAGAEPERVAAHLLKTDSRADPHTVAVLRQAARAALVRGASESAVSYLVRALREPAPETDLPALLIELASAETLVNGPSAAERLARALALVQEPSTRAEVSLLLGQTLYFLSRAVEAIEVYERALDEIGAGPSPVRRLLEAAVSHATLTEHGLLRPAPAHERAARDAVDPPMDLGARWLQGIIAYRDAHAHALARDVLRRGLELATLCGAQPLARRAETELLATGARPRRILLSGPDSLTPSERRVAEMAANGASNREIAQELFVTTKTVEVHLSSAYRELDIGSRAQLRGALSRA